MAEKGVFIRKASGLVREVAPIDAWIYNCLTMGWLSVIAYNVVVNVAIFPGGNHSAAILMTAVLGTFMWTTYIFITTAMPRSGVDWIAQSRFISPWVAAPIVIGDFWYLVYWDVWAYWFATFLGLQPFLTVLGAATNNPSISSFAEWLITPKGLFIVGMIYLFLMGWQLSLPIRLFAKIQRGLMFFATLAIIVMYVVFAMTPNSVFIQRFNMFAEAFGAGADYYHAVIQKASEITNLNPGFRWYDQIGLMVLIWSLLGWAFWSAQLSGEIKGADKLRVQNFVMNGSGWATAIAWLIAWLLISRSAGEEFMKAAGILGFSGEWKLPVAPYLACYLAGATMAPGFGTLIIVVLLILVLGLLCNAYQVYYNTMVGPIRMFFAMAFDRALPDIFSRVHRRWHTPVYLVWLACACAVIQIYLSAYMPEVAPVFLPASLSSGCIPYFFTSLAGALMPYTGKPIYEASPAAKYKLGPIPLVTITGAISCVFNATMAYYWLTVPELGINPASMVFVLIAYVIGFVYYVIWRAYRKRQGINLDLAFKVIPPD